MQLESAEAVENQVNTRGAGPPISFRSWPIEGRILIVPPGELERSFPPHVHFPLVSAPSSSAMASRVSIALATAELLCTPEGEFHVVPTSACTAAESYTVAALGSEGTLLTWLQNPFVLHGKKKGNNFIYAYDDFVRTLLVTTSHRDEGQGSIAGARASGTCSVDSVDFLSLNSQSVEELLRRLANFWCVRLADDVLPFDAHSLRAWLRSEAARLCRQGKLAWALLAEQSPGGNRATPPPHLRTLAGAVAWWAQLRSTHEHPLAPRPQLQAGDWPLADIFARWPVAIAAQLASFVWPIDTISELDRLMACTHASPCALFGCEFTGAGREDARRRYQRRRPYATANAGGRLRAWLPVSGALGRWTPLGSLGAGRCVHLCPCGAHLALGA